VIAPIAWAWPRRGTSRRYTIAKMVPFAFTVVVGTSGLTEQDYAEIDIAAQRHARGVLGVGNFALTVVLMQQFAEMAAKLIPQWEVIDYAHDDKIDAPSGTARELAARLSRVARRNSRFRSSRRQASRRRAARRSQGHKYTPFGCLASSLVPKSFSGCLISGSAFDTTPGAAPGPTSMGRCSPSGGYPGSSACTAAWTRFWTCRHWRPLDLRRFAGQPGSEVVSTASQYRNEVNQLLSSGACR
jgi:dihydrodipicolinate reductase-like protein